MILVIFILIAISQPQDITTMLRQPMSAGTLVQHKQSLSDLLLSYLHFNTKSFHYFLINTCEMNVLPGLILT